MSVSAEKLQELGVGLKYGQSRHLLPFTSLCEEEFDLIHEAFGVDKTWAKTLEIGIGSGVKYALMAVHKERSLEITLSAPADCFAAPLTVEVVVSHEPEELEEHEDGCPYAVAEWVKDEDGEEYWLDENSAEYDEETDTWWVPPQHRIYEPECLCEWIEESRKSFVLGADSDLSLDESAAYVQEVWYEL